MTISISLPASPAVPFVKPTLANTKGGKLYKPTHPELFRVVFEALEGAKPAEGAEEGEEFLSKLVAVRVSHLSVSHIACGV